MVFSQLQQKAATDRPQNVHLARFDVGILLEALDRHWLPLIAEGASTTTQNSPKETNRLVLLSPIDRDHLRENLTVLQDLTHRLRTEQPRFHAVPQLDC
jgi:hypothetical protein